MSDRTAVKKQVHDDGSATYTDTINGDSQTYSKEQLANASPDNPLDSMKGKPGSDKKKKR